MAISYSKSIRVRLTEDQLEFIDAIIRSARSRGIKITRSDVVRKIIDAFIIITETPLIDLIEPIYELEEKKKRGEI